MIIHQATALSCIKCLVAIVEYVAWLLCRVVLEWIQINAPAQKLDKGPDLIWRRGKG
jgi:hypothetical protein